MKDVTLVGKRVRVRPKHWIRPNATGTVIAWETGVRRWIVKFDDPKVGGGFDDGNCLCLEELDFEVFDEV